MTPLNKPTVYIICGFISPGKTTFSKNLQMKLGFHKNFPQSLTERAKLTLGILFEMMGFMDPLQQTPVASQSQATSYSNVPPQSMPSEIKGWNWGAFLLNWIWGIGNGVWIALLMFIPLVNFAMPFVLGAKGNEWAWKSRQWNSVEHFKATQRKWAIVGTVIILLTLIIPLLAGFIFGFFIPKNSKSSFTSISQVESPRLTGEVPATVDMFYGNYLDCQRKHLSNNTGNPPQVDCPYNKIGLLTDALTSKLEQIGGIDPVLCTHNLPDAVAVGETRSTGKGIATVSVHAIYPSHTGNITVTTQYLNNQWIISSIDCNR